MCTTIIAKPCTLEGHIAIHLYGFVIIYAQTIKHYIKFKALRLNALNLCHTENAHIYLSTDALGNLLINKNTFSIMFNV